jgi:pimeloyl-ACP methyl ester carboxylesterase
MASLARLPWGAIGAGAMGLALAGLAVWNVRRARAAERAHPPRGRFVTVDGVRLHYIEQGAGPPVVLLHGNMVTSEDFALSGVMPALAARGWRAIAFDRPGYGHSARPRGRAWTAAEQATLLARACRALGIARPLVVGHSWGTLVALALAQDHPEVPAGLVLISGYYYPTLRPDVALASLVALPLVGDALRYTVLPPLTEATLPLAYRLMFDPRPVPHAIEHGFPRAFAIRPSQLAAENRDGATMTGSVIDMRPGYAALRLPVVIVTGGHDRIVAADRQAAQLHRAIPHSRVVSVPHAGHALHYAVPDQIVDAVDTVHRDAGGRARIPRDDTR